MKIVKRVIGNHYYVIDDDNHVAVINGAIYNKSLKGLVVRLCTTRSSITDVWSDKLVMKHDVVFEYETVEDLIKAYPEYLV